jgi:hypothetical protein
MFVRDGLVTKFKVNITMRNRYTEDAETYQLLDGYSEHGVLAKTLSARGSSGP